MLCPACSADNLPGADNCEECFAPLTHEDIPQPTSRIEKSMMCDQIQTLNPPQALSVSPTASLNKAIAVMREKHIGCVLIADDAGALLGILSERDLLNRVANKRVDLDQATVSQYMTTNPETLVPESFISYALHRMMVGDFRHLPVLEEGSPTAIISSRDILNYIEGHFHETVTRRYDKKMVQEKLKQLAAERAAKEQKDTNG